MVLVGLGLMLAGCAGWKGRPDTRLEKIPLGERYQQYRKLSLIYTNGQVLDADGNTLSDGDMQALFMLEGNRGALAELEGSWRVEVPRFATCLVLGGLSLCTAVPLLIEQ